MPPPPRILSSSTFGKVFTAGLLGLVVIVGLLAFINGIRLVVAGDPNRAGAIAATILGFGLTVGGSVLFYLAFFKGPAEQALRAAIRRRHPNQPWMERREWAARRIVHSNVVPALLMWFWVIGWCGAFALIGTVNYDKIVDALAVSWAHRIAAAIFVLATFVGLTFAVQTTLSWWRFGRSVLRLDTLPAFMGDRLRGRVQARLPSVPAPVQLTLTCEEIRLVQYRKNNSTTSRLDARTLNETTTTLNARDAIATRGMARIPIDIPVPTGFPECDIKSRGDGIRWTLTVRTTRQDGAPFSATFDVPVYERRAIGSPTR